MYVCFLLNHTQNADINSTPINSITGSTAEITPLQHFRFWKPVYYKVDDSNLMSNRTENVTTGLVLTNMLEML